MRIAGLYHPTQEIKDNTFLLEQPEWLGYLLLISYYVMVVLAIIGAVVMRRRSIAIWPLVAILVIVLLSVAVTFAQTRYRAPAEIAFVLAAAVAIDAGITALRRRTEPAREPELQAVGSA